MDHKLEKLLDLLIKGLENSYACRGTKLSYDQ